MSLNGKIHDKPQDSVIEGGTDKLDPKSCVIPSMPTKLLNLNPQLPSDTITGTTAANESCTDPKTLLEERDQRRMQNGSSCCGGGLSFEEHG